MKISKLRENTDSDVLNQDGYYPGSKSGNVLIYHSAFRHVQKPSFTVNDARVVGMITVTPAAEVLLTGLDPV